MSGACYAGEAACIARRGCRHRHADGKPTMARTDAVGRDRCCHAARRSANPSSGTRDTRWRSRGRASRRARCFECVSLAVRDLMIDRRLETEQRHRRADAKHLYYLSIEYLLGRSLANNLSNLGIYDLCRDTLRRWGSTSPTVEESERDAALGNGGLGRLAACFLDSLATLDMPGYGYGINYEYGLFRQEIDARRSEGEAGQLARRSGRPGRSSGPRKPASFPSTAGSSTASIDRGQLQPDVAGLAAPDRRSARRTRRRLRRPDGEPAPALLRTVVARLRHADLQRRRLPEGGGTEDRVGDRSRRSSTRPTPCRPVRSCVSSRSTSWSPARCATSSARYERDHRSFDAFADKVAIQLNDTHPALAVAELMRILVDERDLPWDTAWQITQATMGYTNHTLMPEALEKWPVALLEHVVPRHLQIIYEINRRFLEHVASVWPGDPERLRRMSLIEEGTSKQVRMAHLAIVGSHSVNGVSALHSQLVQTTLAPDFYRLWPERFNNKTNGVTPRRWLVQANPLLARLITGTIGDGWITDLDTAPRRWNPGRATAPSGRNSWPSSAPTRSGWPA